MHQRDVVVFFLGISSWLLVWRPALRWLLLPRSPRRPINEFLGKILPHPLDERWRIATAPHSVENGVVHVRWNEGNIIIANNQLMLSPRDVERAKEYGLAIYLNLKKLAAEATHAKALEVLEQKQDEISGLL
jgi:hypothetical protein